MTTKKRFEYNHTVSFEETNLVGNVYFTNFFKWQGRCREFFLKEHASSILPEIENGNLALITLNSSCEFLGELKAFDEIKVCMYLAEMNQNRVKMKFEYYRLENHLEKIVATGIHEIGCFKRDELRLIPVEIPPILFSALQQYNQGS